MNKVEERRNEEKKRREEGGREEGREGREGRKRRGKGVVHLLFTVTIHKLNLIIWVCRF